MEPGFDVRGRVDLARKRPSHQIRYLPLNVVCLGIEAGDALLNLIQPMDKGPHASESVFVCHGADLALSARAVNYVRLSLRRFG